MVDGSTGQMWIKVAAQDMTYVQDCTLGKLVFIFFSVFFFFFFTT